ncbi:hypothetical protein QQP08_016682 [Theobroma cacao]|nr:hypothetical protein QQP08_016682 [Theobroma cacao]
MENFEDGILRFHKITIKGESSQKCKAEYSMGKTQGKSGFHDRGRGRGRSRGPHSENKQHKSSIQCHYCKKHGHKEADCCAKSKEDNNQANS